MKQRCATALVLLLIVFASLPASAQLKKVRLSTPTIAITQIPFTVAQAKGFYREEGLDLEIIVIRGQLGVTALLGGSVDYTTASGSVIAAAVRGIGVKLVLIVDSKPAFDFVADPKIRSFQALKGKAIGISSRGGSVDLLTRLALEQNKLDADKDVTLLVIGTQPEMVIALKTGKIAAALISPPRNQLLYRDGFYKLASAGDYLATHPTGGIGVTDEKLKSNPAEILSFVRGTLKGIKFYRENRSDAVNLIVKELRMSDASLAGEVYDWHLHQLANNGSGNQSWMRGAIEFTKKSLGVTKEIPPEQVFDFTFIERALR